MAVLGFSNLFMLRLLLHGLINIICLTERFKEEPWMYIKATTALGSCMFLSSVAGYFVWQDV